MYPLRNPLREVGMDLSLSLILTLIWCPFNGLLLALVPGPGITHTDFPLHPLCSFTYIFQQLVTCPFTLCPFTHPLKY